MELLGNPNQDITLEEVFKFVEIKEAGKRSASNRVRVFKLILAAHTDDQKNDKLRKQTSVLDTPKLTTLIQYHVHIVEKSAMGSCLCTHQKDSMSSF